MSLKKQIASLIWMGGLGAVSFTGTPAFSEPLPIATSAIAAKGYVYGFPAVLMMETMNAATTAPYPCNLGGPVNWFFHKLDTPTPEFRAVVRPNVDTLYSSAFLDLSEGPVMLEVPEIKNRFYLMAMLDVWTNNFAGPGTQTNGGEAHSYLMRGRHGQANRPKGLK